METLGNHLSTEEIQSLADVMIDQAKVRCDCIEDVDIMLTVVKKRAWKLNTVFPHYKVLLGKITKRYIRRKRWEKDMVRV